MGTLQNIFKLLTLVSVLNAYAAPSPDAAQTDLFQEGVNLYHQQRYDGAVQALRQVPELGGYLSLYKHWFLGQALIELGKYKEAEPEVAKIIQGAASTEMRHQAQFLSGEIALRQKKYPDVLARLTPLERKWRNSYRYPEVLFKMMVADLRLGHHSSACKLARKLYSKYPAHSTVIHWNSDLRAAEVDGKSLNCKTDPDDFSDRVRSLQWSGESEKARKEILAQLNKNKDRFESEMLLASFMVNEGEVNEALISLTRHFPQQKTNVAYLLLLGKAAARAGEYQTSVGAYERVYELTPKSKTGLDALYQAAYLSYQFQDYDGAVRKFLQYSKVNPRSKLAREAQWHLAWLQYLRNDYRGALERFEQLIRPALNRNSRGELLDRLIYWMAMSRIRLNQTEEARADFDRLVAKNPYSYYGLAAQARLDALPARPTDGPQPSLWPSFWTRMVASAGPATIEAGGGDSDIAENETEPTLNEEAEDSGPETAAKEGSEDEDHLKGAEVKDPALRARIDVAQRLIELGLPDLAKWEMVEVERHTRNSQLLRQLLAAYEGIGSFNRSATIAELSFARDRELGGLDGARNIWVAAYPQAYKNFVQKSSREFGVAPEWVWSIMRAESLYKPDVISPVGAKGLMQLMQYTARNLTRLRGEGGENFDLLKPHENIRLGSQYLARLQTQFKGKLPLVAAAYNAGPHRVESWLVNFGHLDTDEFIEHIPFMETRNYVKKVVRYNTFYRRLYAKETNASSFLAKGLGVPIPSRAATKERW